MAISYLIPGVDLLSLPCITPADVQQAIANAKPQQNIGFIIRSENAPDVGATPELANFLWAKLVLGVPNGDYYYYNGTSWVLLTIIDGASIANHTITPNKLSVLGAVPYDIIQVNAAGTDFQFTSIVNAIQNGIIPVNKLISGGASHVLVSLAGVNQFITLASLVTYFASNSVPINSLVRGGVSTKGLLLRTLPDGSAVAWYTFNSNEQIDDEELSINKLSAASIPVGANQSFRRNSLNNAWEAFTPAPIPPTVETYDTNSAVASTQDIILTKPNGKVWQTFEVAYVGGFNSNGSSSAVSVDLTWETAPLVGSPLTPSSAAGAGNSGQIFNIGNSDDHPSPTWMFKGTIPPSLVNINSLTLRATINPGVVVHASGVFMGKGVYNA